ncbi:MAG: tRNA pseudouridine(55) synthase TruB, partial [Actinobacteria bacterium]|nr:tRNA pseudouridine(55) synthase TruB [Actinomycetota bacterium]
IIRFGIETDTLDICGNIISEKDISGLNIERINKVLSGFRGNIKQVPPMYSALKYKGKPLYKIARNGISVERKSREVEITGIEVTGFDGCLLTVKVGCSSGTYIRTLASDIGKALKTGAVLSVLKRTKIGSFSMERSIKLEELLDIAGMDILPDDSSMIMDMEELFDNNPSIYIKEEYEEAVKNGKRIRVDMVDTGKTDICKLRRSHESRGTGFERIVLVRSFSDKVLAVHYIIEETVVDGVESFKQEFTKSIVIF